MEDEKKLPKKNNPSVDVTEYFASDSPNTSNKTRNISSDERGNGKFFFDNESVHLKDEKATKPYWEHTKHVLF